MDYNKLITEAQDNNIADMYDTFSHILADKVLNGIDARRATIASSLLEDCGCEACHAKSEGAKSKKKRKLEELTVKSMDKKASLDVYKRLKKGDKVAVEFGSAMSATGTKPIELVVTSPHRVVGKSKVGRIILKNPKNMRGMKYTLYNRNGVVSLAQGDMGTILKDLKIMNESVELGEMKLKPKVSKKYPDRTSDGFEGPYTSGQRAGRMFYYDTKADRFYDADSTEFKKRLKESVELDEMSAKQHYAKFKRGGRGKGFVVSSPIDRDRYPNRERQGLEGPYKSRKSGKIFYYDKKAGKYYDPDSDMYLQVSDVMEANEKIKVKLDPKKKIGYTIHNVGPGGKKTLVKSRDMPGKKDVG